MAWTTRKVLFERVGELEAELERLRQRAARGEPPDDRCPACGDEKCRIGWEYFTDCNKCLQPRILRIDPMRLRENHTMQRQYDEERADRIVLNSPEADRARAMAAAEQREEAEAKARKRTRELRAEAMADVVDVLQKQHDGPWGQKE